MITRKEDANRRMEEEQVRDVMVGSMDVVALYPSIDQKVGAQIVAEELVRNQVTYKGVDMEKVVQYLAATMSAERQAAEGVEHLIPKKRVVGKQ